MSPCVGSEEIFRGSQRGYAPRCVPANGVMNMASEGMTGTSHVSKRRESLPGRTGKAKKASVSPPAGLGVKM